MPSTRTMARPRLRAAGSAASAFLLALIVVLLPTSAHAAAAGDDFNRADGGLGASWTTLDGTVSISGGRAGGTENSSALLSGASGTRVSVDAFASGGLSYVALLAGYSGPSSAYFAKVQDGDQDGRFETVWFYYGENGIGSVGTMPLVPSVVAARLALTMSGTTGVFTIDSNFDGIADQTYSANFPGTATPAAGIGFFGAARADNFAVDSTPVTLDAPDAAAITVGSGSLTVSADAQGAAPVGDIILEISGQASQTVALDEGAAEFDLSGLPVGSYTYTARFPLGNGYESAQTTGAITVSVVPTATALTAASGSLAVGAATTLTATVTPASGTPTGAPTGTVEFFDGVTSLGTSAVSGGVATLSYQPTAAGAHSLTAAYSGSATHVASTSAATPVTVTRAVSMTTVTLSSGSVTIGDSATVTATVTAAGVTPTGTVEFFDGVTSLGAAALAGGSAMVVLSAPGVGTHPVTAVYAGTADVLPSTSAAQQLEVVLHAATVTLTAPATLRSGTPATLRATVASGIGAPPGTVEFFANGVSLGTAGLSAGVAELTVPDLPPGSVTLGAIYNGTATVATATGSLTVEVAAAVPQLVLTGADASIWPYAALLLVLGSVLLGFAARRRAA